ARWAANREPRALGYGQIDTAQGVVLTEPFVDFLKSNDRIILIRRPQRVGHHGHLKPRRCKSILTAQSPVRTRSESGSPAAAGSSPRVSSSSNTAPPRSRTLRAHRTSPASAFGCVA